ncbi:histone-fold-containing protein [Epithele typhae]|uniref:histone-fold-containing protein n=1 Tax=Epithele typhae TaxID=378194 RepID=UPI002007E57E|nr:histone-fold-containing protein [Epithele typhae]KAH9939771.1 histone-fold-containing protein [Epithele typhae]
MKNKNKTTKFPVARIKRIMQKDEEVGKVAQATPVVISKALELFLAMLVQEASNVTTDRGSKRVEAYHLKHAIDTVDMLDFLKEIVEAVPDPSAGGTIDIEAENAEARAKKRGKGKDKKGAQENGAEKAAPKRRRRKASDKEKEEEEAREEEAEMDDEEDEDEGFGRQRGKRDDSDEEWAG